MLKKTILLSALICCTLATTVVSAQKSSVIDNQLTEKEKKAGWKLLFDGKTLAGWKGFKKDTVGKYWKASEGTLHLSQGGAGDVMSVEQYENFELKLDWKIAEGGNSGIFWGVIESADYNNTYETGPEMQVLDDDKHPDAKNGKDGNHKAGALYDMIPAANKKLKKAGVEFNQVVIKKLNNNVEFFLNGVKVVSFAQGSPAWDKMVAYSKFNGWKGFGKFAKGHIALQDHGDKVWYKNIKIRRL